jgi:hypothetical protein
MDIPATKIVKNGWLDRDFRKTGRISEAGLARKSGHIPSFWLAPWSRPKRSSVSGKLLITLDY